MKDLDTTERSAESDPLDYEKELRRETGEKKRLEEYHHKAKERGAPHEGGRKPGFGSTPAAGTHAPQTHRRADGSVDHSNVMKPHGERGPDIVEEERIFEEERRGIVPPKDVQDDAS